MGASAFVSRFHADNLVVESSGPAYQAFSKALLSQQGKVPGATGDFTTYLSAPGGVHLYDGINLAALAMVMSKSTSPSVYGPDIIKIGNGVPGATVCYSFAQCATALKAGQGHQVRRARRADQLRQLPRLDRHLPGRYLHRAPAR